MSLLLDIEKMLPSFHLKVNFKQEKGILGFLGASGSGKSMTLRCIAGLEAPDAGKIIVNNNDYFNSNNKINLKPQQRKTGFLFQNYALFPNMSITENIQVGLGKINKVEKLKLTNEYIERLGLGGLERHYPWQLSGGQQQRVALARALITAPDILLLDEPFSALDHHLRHSMEKELMSILKDYTGNVIFVTHDIEEAFRVCDNIIVYDKGLALNNRNKHELFHSPNTFAEAKITGCKNISSAKVIGDNLIYAENFGYEYFLNFNIPTNTSYIGIRAHHIELCTNNKTDKNCHPFIVENILENPFDYTIYIRNPKLSKDNLIDFYLSKSELNFSKGTTIWVKFSPENIFCF